MLLALGAGLASFLSPCVLPLVPVYLAFLTGTSLTGLQESGSRRLVLAHAACFIVGFSLVFIALGASASLLGSLLFRYRSLIERLGGLVLAVLGLWMLGAFQATFLYKDARFH
ncbi:MAG TPA: cytochrome c biogenesis protein CcdA, partial [Elusimicrobiota bacterium]|nr:cytochrome c biogenesis protein CcdA [Elusimicrobiota bacterium]